VFGRHYSNYHIIGWFVKDVLDVSKKKQVRCSASFEQVTAP